MKKAGLIFLANTSVKEKAAPVFIKSQPDEIKILPVLDKNRFR